MLTKHYVGFRKYINGAPTPTQIEVIVYIDGPRKEAVRIAKEEMRALEEGWRLRARRAIRREIRHIEKNCRQEDLATFIFQGVN